MGKPKKKPIKKAKKLSEDIARGKVNKAPYYEEWSLKWLETKKEKGNKHLQPIQASFRAAYQSGYRSPQSRRD